MFTRQCFAAGLAALCLAAPIAGRASAGTIYASGQLLIENTPGVHDDVRENRLYRIDTATGHATPLPVWSTTSTPAGLAGVRGGTLYGFRGAQLGLVDPQTADSFSPIGAPSGVSATAFDILADGRAYVVTFGGNRQLYVVDLVSGAATAVGPAGQIGAAFDVAFGLAAGTSAPFIISLGSVGDQLYGINLESGRQNLVRIDPATGTAEIIGAADAVDANDSGRYSGYSALTGVDENADGQFDALFGTVNFWNHDGDSNTSDLRLGGIARYDLANGTWSLVGTNPGVIFFGMGASPVPEPGTLALAAMAVGCFALRLRKRLRNAA
jgi:hypothetical protein